MEDVKTVLDIYENIQDWVIDKKKDWVTAITGYQGAGKSTLAFYLANMLNWRLKRKYPEKVEEFLSNFAQKRKTKISDDKIPVSSYIFFEIPDYLSVDEIAPPGWTLVFDEAGTRAFSRDSMHKLNIQLAKVFTINRFKQHIHFLCIPHFHWLDIYFREARVRTVIHLHEVVIDFKDSEIYGYFIPRSKFKKIMRLKKWAWILSDPEKIEKYKLYTFKFHMPKSIFKKVWSWPEAKEYDIEKEKADQKIRKEIHKDDKERLWEKFYQLLQEEKKWAKVDPTDKESRMLIMARILKIRYELSKIKEELKKLYKDWMEEAIKRMKIKVKIY